MDSRNEYQFNPWEKDLLWHASNVESSIYLVSPFIKLPIIKKILSVLPNQNIKIRLLTRFTKQVFNQGSSDLSVFDLLLNHNFSNLSIDIHHLSKLHAKIYIFDNKEMYLTSSNLSFS